jgi:ribosomal silencing factor RsfS
MSQDEKLLFFLSLEEIACSEDVSRLEMLQLSQSVKNKFNTESVALSDQSRIMLADLILIGMNKNQQHVKSIASNFRKSCVVTAAHSKRSK